MSSSPTLATSRVRLQRVSDGVTHWGWLRTQGPQSAIVRLDSPLVLVVNEEYLLQVASGSRVTTDHCWTVALQDRDVELRLRGEAKVSAPVKAPRAAVRSLAAKVSYRDREATAQVVDASETGAGLLCWISVDPGETLVVTVQSHRGPSVATAEVRYCRPTQELGQFRIGVQITGSTEGTVPWSVAISDSDPQLRQAA